MSFIKVKLVNEELLEKVKEYYKKYYKMYDIANFYIEELKDQGYGVFTPAILLCIDQTFIEFVGIKNSISSDRHKKTDEIFHPNFNVSRTHNSEMYQPLKKNKFNKEKTNNFEDTKVDFSVLLEVVFNDPSPIDFKGKIMRYKPLSASFTDNVFIATIERDDMTQHTLDNFVEV